MVSRIATPFAVVPVAASDRSAKLQAGETFEARVLRHLGQSAVRVAANGFHLDLAIDPLLPVGARVNLTVVRGADGLHYRVETLPEDAAANTALPQAGASGTSAQKASEQVFAETAIARLVGAQGGLAPLFASLAAIHSSEGTPLPQVVQAAIADLLGLRLGSTAGLGGEVLRRAILRAGSLGDPESLQGAGAASLRSGLARLRTVLAAIAGQAAPDEGEPPELPSVARHPRGQPPAVLSHAVFQALNTGSSASLIAHLLGQVEGALARLTLSALASTGGLEGGDAAHGALDVTLELPLAIDTQTAVIQLQIGKDRAGQDGEEEGHAAWRLRFAVDLPETGAVEALVGLDLNRLFVTLWVERTETLADFRNGIEGLKASLVETGLIVEDLRIVQGRPSDPPARSGIFVDTRS